MTAPVLFESPEFALRFIDVDGENWFVATDICDALGYVNSRSAVATHVDPDDRITVAHNDGNRGNPNKTAVNESGMYALIFGSQLAEAKRFKRWVTSEVLPQIHKTGSYNATPALPQSFAEALELAAVQARQLEQLEAQVAVDAPKVAAHDLLCEADGAISMNDAAKRLGVGLVTLFRLLREDHVLIGEGKNRNLPYQSHAHHFRVTSGTHEEHGRRVQHRTTLVRPSGLSFIAGRLGLVERPVLELVSSG